jgi:hypothetical protein
VSLTLTHLQERRGKLCCIYLINDKERVDPTYNPYKYQVDLLAFNPCKYQVVPASAATAVIPYKYQVGLAFNPCKYQVQ